MCPKIKFLLLAGTLASCWASIDMLPQDKVPTVLHRLSRSLITVPGAIIEDYASSTFPCNGEGFYSHTSDCTKFYRCIDVFGNQDYLKLEFKCHAGTIFSPGDKSCISGSCSTVLASASSATDVVPSFGHKNIHSSSSSSEYESSQCKSEGRFADVNDCGKFYDCVPSHNGGFVVHQQSCFGNAFHPTLKACVTPQMVKGCIPFSTRSLTHADPQLQHLCNNEENDFICADCKTLIICVDGNAYTESCAHNNVCSMKNSFGGGVCYPGDPVVCTCNKADIFRRDLYNPSKFLSCGIKDTDPIIHSCSAGLEFNEERRTCGLGTESTCTSQGTFAVKDNCTNYLICIFTVGGWVHKQLACRNNTMFNEETGKCEDPCDWYGAHFTCEREGRFGNPTDCKKYYECTADPLNSDRFSWVEKECPEDYEWIQVVDSSSGHCMASGANKEKCVPLKPNKCKVPKEWCIAVAGKITNVMIKSLTPYSMDVDWNKPLENPFSITNYTVKWVNSNGGAEQEDTVTVPPYNITDITACTNYNVTVIAYTKRGPEEPSDMVALTTGMVAGKSTNVTSKILTPDALEVDWSLPLGNPCPITKYTVKWVNSRSGEEHRYTVTEPPCTITGPFSTACMKSNITVIAYTEEGPGEPSDSVTFTPPVAGKSTSVTSKTLTPYVLEVDWSLPLGNPCPITKYTVIWVNNEEEQRYTVTEPPYTITGPFGTACMKSNITVIAYTEEGPGEPSDSVTFTPPVAGKITNVRRESFTPDFVEVNWNQPLDNPCPITKYTMKWITSNGDAEEEITVTEPSYTISGLTSCTSFNVSVIAYTEGGPGEPSNTVTLATSGVPDGFEVFNGRVIRRTKNGDQKGDYDYAIGFCDQFGGKPFIPRTMADYQLYYEVEASLDSYMRLPADDRDEEGTLKWYTGEVDSDITRWEWCSDQDLYLNSYSMDCILYSRTPCVHFYLCSTGFYPPICEKICS